MVIGTVEGGQFFSCLQQDRWVFPRVLRAPCAGPNAILGRDECSAPRGVVKNLGK
jgi:hypothetical protein